MLYSRSVGLEVRDIKAPYPGIIMDIVEHPSYLELRVYEDNIMSFDEHHQIGIMLWLMRIKDRLETKFGIRCEFGGQKGNGQK